MANKKTKKDFFNELLEIEVVASNKEMVDFINHEIELLSRKRNSNTMTKTQVENENIKNVIVETLQEVAKFVTISELQENNSELAELSNQKISALLKQLVDTEVIKKQVVKKKAYFGV